MSFAEGIDRFVCADLLVHRWDLARAAGLEVTLPTDEVARVHAGLAAMGDVLRGPGAFGPEVPAPEGADAQARLLALLGRRPRGHRAGPATAGRARSERAAHAPRLGDRPASDG